jgi:hypothetical protein
MDHYVLDLFKSIDVMKKEETSAEDELKETVCLNLLD